MTATFVARLWLPDIPGTLGLVAAAIGRSGGDVIGIEILERGASMAVDELLVELPDPSRVEMLIGEVSGVPGVSVEDIHRVEPERRDQSILALDIAAQIVEEPESSRLTAMCVLLRSMLEADWCTVMEGSRTAMTEGAVPDAAWLQAFVEGIRHLDVAASFENTPGDIAWAPMRRSGGFVVCGRRKSPFRSRERQHLSLIVRIADSVLGLGPASGSVDGA